MCCYSFIFMQNDFGMAQLCFQKGISQDNKKKTTIYVKPKWDNRNCSFDAENKIKKQTPH